MNRKWFGTDGIRGIANKDLTPEFVLKLGRVLAGYLKEKQIEEGRNKIIIGYDTRISKDLLGCAIKAGIMSVGIDVLDVGILSTPALSYLVKEIPEVICGIMISASHNPLKYNGIKVFNNDGFKLSDEIESEIEALLENEDKFDRPIEDKLGRNYEYKEGVKKYEDYLKSIINMDLSNQKIMIDCAFGAVSDIAPRVFKALGAKVIPVNFEYDGTNINKNCGAVYPEKGYEIFRNTEADIGFTYDGDGDRVLVFSKDAGILDGDKILGILATYLKSKNSLKDDTVVGTIMSNLGLEEYLRSLNINLVRTKVGDRYILEEIRKNGFNVGGEPSGHIIIFDYLNTGDGLLTSLLLLKILKEEKWSLSDLSRKIPQYPQITENLPLERKLKNDEIEKIEEIVKEVINEERLRYIVRQSGTENVLRITLEGDVPEERLKKYLKNIRDKVYEILD
ncbi:MAG: phosphoglucosamine mutase [Dictyoglomus sp. NZ13-RE01]|nr:MAG: phosphoglucosamine mutase [Dictyoglomus sp. NZ13-RE01]